MQIRASRLTAGAVAIAALAAMAAPSGAAGAVRTLRATEFTTRVPSGWTVSRGAFRGARTYRLRAPGARVDASGATRGGPVIDLIVVPRAAVRRLFGVSRAPDPSVLAGAFAVPAGAVDEITLLPVEDAALGGARAAQTVLAYRSGATQNFAAALVGTRAGTLAFVSVTAEPGRAAAAGTATRLVTSGWRWRLAATGRAPRGPFAEAFVGATAQGEVVALDVRPDHLLAYAFRFRPVCAALGALPHQSDQDITPIHTTRRVQDHFTDSYDPDGNPRPVIGGRPRNLLLTTAADFTGRLLTRTLAHGTLRERVVVLDRDLFPGGGVLDTCDTGVMPWQAARFF